MPLCKIFPEVQAARNQKCQRMTNAVKTTFNIIIVCTYVQYVKYKQFNKLSM